MYLNVLTAQKFYLLDPFSFLASLLHFIPFFLCFVFQFLFLFACIRTILAVQKEIEETMHNIEIKIPYNNNNNNVSDDNIDNMPLF